MESEIDTASQMIAKVSCTHRCSFQHGNTHVGIHKDRSKRILSIDNNIRGVR